MSPPKPHEGHLNFKNLIVSAHSIAIVPRMIRNAQSDRAKIKGIHIHTKPKQDKTILALANPLLSEPLFMMAKSPPFIYVKSFIDINCPEA